MVLNSNRNYPRKRLDLSIRGFAEIAGETDAVLYLHVSDLSAYERRKLESLIASCDLVDRVLLNHLNPTGLPLSTGKLLQLYRACDIGLTTAMGEGWGLGSFEHAATGAAQVVPNHTTFDENWPADTAVRIPAGDPIYVDFEAAEMYACSPTDVGHALLGLLEGQGRRADYADAALAHTRADRFQWTTVGRRFDAALRALAGSSDPQ